MRIAVDARPLSHPGTGIYRYTRELLLRMCPMGGEWYFYSPQPYRTEEFERDNVIHRCVEVPAYLGGSQASQLLFPRWLKQDEIDLFWGTRHHLPLRMPADVPAVLTVHDLVWRQQASSMRWSRRWSERLLMPVSIDRAQCIVTGTEYIAGEIREHFPATASRLTVIPYASCFQPGPVASAPEGEAGFFLFVGTMEPRKNLPTLLRAYQSYLSQTRAPRKLRLVGGGGWGGIDAAKMVGDLGLLDWVEIHGRVSDDALADLYRRAYALVMPSLYEGFGLPVVEALSFGLPVIVSKDSALSETAGNAACGVDPASDASICEAMLRLDTDAELYRRLHAAASSRAAVFSWERSAAEMYGLLRNHM